MSSEKERTIDTTNATKQEIYAALKLIELLYLQGEDTQTHLQQHLQ